MRRFLLFSGLVFFAAAHASGGSISSCSSNSPAPGVTCNIFETDSSGNPSEISSVFALGESAVAGYVVLLEASGLDPTNVANWSDVLQFIDGGGGFASTAQLFSVGCNCFPSYATVNGGGGTFIAESPTAPTVYSPSGTDLFFINSNEETVPEPAAILLMGAGLVAVLFRKRYLMA